MATIKRPARQHRLSLTQVEKQVRSFLLPTVLRERDKLSGSLPLYDREDRFERIVKLNRVAVKLRSLLAEINKFSLEIQEVAEAINLDEMFQEQEDRNRIRVDFKEGSSIWVDDSSGELVVEGIAPRRRQKEIDPLLAGYRVKNYIEYT